MKRVVSSLSIIFSFFLFSSVSAQTFTSDPFSPPLRNSSAPMFGKDIVLNDQPDQNQRNVAVCSAFNGWLYACYWHTEPDGFSYYIVRSLDNGISWTEIFSNFIIAPVEYIKKMDILACGETPDNLKVFLALVVGTDDFIDKGLVSRYNGLTGEFEDEILKDWEFSRIHDIAIASDYLHPATGSNPYSIAILYSKHIKWTDYEKLVYCSSSNGGISMDSIQELQSSTERKFFRVDLAYAWSPSKNTGRYYGIWEEKQELYDPYSHIYTAHTEPNFESPFTTPVCLDSLDNSIIYQCLDPAIGCQVDELDNDLSDITQLVLFETVDEGTNSKNLKGYYNKASTTTNVFQEYSFTDLSHDNIQGDIEYNPFDHNFQITYFDSTDKKLPLLSNEYNMINPNTWNSESGGYNDDDNIGLPHPQVKMNYLQNEAMNVWIADRPDGKGVALFDAPYSTYTSTDDDFNVMKLDIKIFPNPCISQMNVFIALQEDRKISFTILNSLGKSVKEYSDISCSVGNSNLVIDISTIQPGYYILLIKVDSGITARGIIITR